MFQQAGKLRRLRSRTTATSPTRTKTLLILSSVLVKTATKSLQAVSILQRSFGTRQQVNNSFEWRAGPTWLTASCSVRMEQRLHPVDAPGGIFGPVVACAPPAAWPSAGGGGATP